MANLFSCFPSHVHTFFVDVIIIIAFFHLCCSVSSTQIRCLEEDRSLLLRLKQEISIDVDYYYYYYPDESPPPPPKVWSWNGTDNHEDCCLWEGVTCDSYSGDVVGLDLSESSIVGGINDSSSIFHLRHLRRLSLAYNYMFPSTFPSGFGNLSSLTHLNLSDAGFGGPIPEHDISRLEKLVSLDLTSSSRDSSVDMEKLVKNLTQLKVLRLDDVDLSRTINNKSWSTLPADLQELSLRNCNFTGEALQLSSFLHLKSSLTHLTLSDNDLAWNISRYSFIQFPHLVNLQLSYCSIPISYSSDRFRDLQYLNLGNNNLGRQIPPSLFSLPALQALGLDSNQLEGQLEGFFNSSSELQHIYLSHNKLQGHLPMSIFNMSSLAYFSVASNDFSGRINLTDIANIENLMHLDLSENHFQIGVTESLGLCKDLEVVDVGKNYLTGKFPLWLENLPLLRILILHSNQFDGTVESKNSSGFPLLQIFDVSSNKFVGRLPLGWFTSWKEMMKQATPPGSQTEVINLTHYIQYPGIAYKSYYQDSVTVTAKGIEREYDKILTSFVLIDVSNNIFTGEIPEAIASLESIHLLNLSNNHFTGHIPVSFGQLSQLESLDLSSNNLSGNIPPQLTKLTFMSKLNLSHNSLTREIPRGFQFENFEPDSYEGNPGLCGKPLPKSCYNVKSPPLGYKPNDEDEGGHGFIDWEYYRLGIECGVGTGLILGFVVAYLVFGNF
ncbi:Receptor like protein 27 [Linum perenne]